MNFNYEVLTATRQNILAALDGFSIEQLNKIPEGFGNNLIWNFGHVVVTQQLLCYGLSGLPMHLSKEMITKYRKGSKPNDFVSTEEFELLKKLAIDLIEVLKKDYENDIFKTYKTYTTSYNITLTSVDDAIVFNNTHEGLHYGSILALRKLV